MPQFFFGMVACRPLVTVGISAPMLKLKNIALWVASVDDAQISNATHRGRSNTAYSATASSQN